MRDDADRRTEDYAIEALYAARGPVYWAIATQTKRLAPKPAPEQNK